MWTRTQGLVAAACAVALALRLGPLFDNRFHPDEALFSTWALTIAHGDNVWLSGVPVDKPPLLLYVSALSFFVLGRSELAGRVPNLLASVISVALIYQTARVSLRREWATVPAWLLALSPFAILFAPTAFLDPMMIMLGLAALAAAVRGRAGWAGLLLGLSVATKVQGLFFAPLVIMVRPPRGQRAWLRLVIGWLSVLLAVLAWDRLRGGVPFWQQQTINYGELRLITSSELGPRLTGWLAFLPDFFGPIVGAIGVVGVLALIAAHLRSGFRSRTARLDFALCGWLLGILALHWLIDFPIWDRYVLLLVPVAAWLAGRGGAALAARVRPARRALPFVLLLITGSGLPYSLAAAGSQYPIGGDHGANDGIDQVAAFLKTLPSGTVVYEHGQAWELGFYLGEGFAYLSYFDTPVALAGDVRVFGGEGRYVILAARQPSQAVRAVLQPLGYTLRSVFETRNRFGQLSFEVYEIIPTAGSAYQYVS
jgi:4-amino-4-deoxy-L-arabinose transferase-like glycosyltransferase